MEFIPRSPSSDRHQQHRARGHRRGNRDRHRRRHTELENRLPETHILLLGILPSAISDNKTERDHAVNRYLATCYSEIPQVTYLDIGSIFYSNGTLSTSLFYDPRLPQHRKPLHPDTNGQRMMAEAIEPTLARLMHDTPQQPLASMTDINTAVIPVERLEPDVYDWYARHNGELDLKSTCSRGSF